MSCSPDPFNGYMSDGGIHLYIVNRTENTYTGNQSLYIGGVKNNKFHITDSIISNDVIYAHTFDGDITSYTRSDIKGVQDWRPNLSLIRKISEKGAFLFIMSNGEHLFLNPFDFPTPKLEGKGLGIHIGNDGLTYDNNISQNLEIIR